MKYGSNYSWSRHLDIAVIEVRIAKEIAEHEARLSSRKSAAIIPFKPKGKSNDR